MDNNIPVFTPPVPTFTPPTNDRVSGKSCYFHQNEPAVDECARCGKPLCQDCVDNYQVNGGEYAGEPLCYDCCQQLVADNVRELTRNKRKIKFHFILSIIGMSIGFLLGLVSGIAAGSVAGGLIYGVIFAGVGGCFLSFLKFYFSMLWTCIKVGFKQAFENGIWGVVGVFIRFIFEIIVALFKCIYYTIRNTIDYLRYMKQTSGFIESDKQALQQMADYMEYTLVRSQNVGVDLATLMSDNGQLANNSYAQNVMQNGEENAEAALRNCVTTINENGEIIRSFAA